MKIEETGLPGCRHIQPRLLTDLRGRFVKTFHAGLFAEYGLKTGFVETFYSVSRRGVLRGLHFQAPPCQHAKLVYCVYGKVLDAVVDIRRGSPTEGQSYAVELCADRGNMLYMPEGFAHGMLALTDEARVAYQVTSVFSPEYDAGIRWDTAGIAWPERNPILSARDLALPPWDGFHSPFTYAATAARETPLRKI